MGAELEVVARFPDGSVKISNFSELENSVTARVDDTKVDCECEQLLLSTRNGAGGTATKMRCSEDWRI